MEVVPDLTLVLCAHDAWQPFRMSCPTCLLLPLLHVKH